MEEHKSNLKCSWELESDFGLFVCSTCGAGCSTDKLGFCVSDRSTWPEDNPPTTGKTKVNLNDFINVK